MRHRVYGKHLGRNKDQRRNLFKGLVYSLLSSGTIKTSEIKAKAIKGLIDKVITLAKGKTTQGRFQSLISDKDLRDRLVKEIVPKLGARTSGYTSTVKLGARAGDQTMMVKLSLIGAERLSVPSSQLSDKSKSVVSKSVTEKPKTDKLTSENRKPKTDNRKAKKVTSRSKK